MADNWSDRMQAIRSSLMTLEINTVTSTADLSAQKMPEVPLAMHALIQAYSNYLSDSGFPITVGLLKASAQWIVELKRLETNAQADASTTLQNQLKSWPWAPPRKFTDMEVQAGLDQIGSPNPAWSAEPADDPTNGAETFAALKWAAWAGMQTLRAGGRLDGGGDSAVLSRIFATCKQMQEVALRLEQQHDPSPGGFLGFLSRQPKLQDSILKSGERMLKMMPTADPQATETDSRLFGGTVQQTYESLFRHPRPVFNIDPDLTILIRKAWDLGTKSVRMQTVLQIDGDVSQIIGPFNADQREERDFLVALHANAVKQSVTQWRNFVEVLGALLKGAASFVTGRG
jgi:hypothetical protein